MTPATDSQRASSGHPMFDEFVARGIDPDSFNQAYGHFARHHPQRDFADAIASLRVEPTPARRLALAAGLFGRASTEIVEFLG